MNVSKGVKGFIALPLEKRFWSKVQKKDENGCWEWLGSTDGRYGSLWVNGRLRKAHRVSYELHFGPIPKGLIVCHLCDNPKCVRPDHLFLGTQSDNLIDASRKGRNGAHTHPERLARGNNNGARKHPERLARGERNKQAKLTTEAVQEIRRLKGVVKQKDLAKKFGVSRRNIQSIQYGHSWKHLPINGGV